jgi:class 3 adenylate cyclase
MASEDVRRKLTTILAADVVAYSAMMAADEEATLATLRTYRQVMDDLIARHGGRLFNTAGDAVLVEFPSAVEAVRCAISIQEDLAVRNAQLTDDRKMRFRIGVNVGDVMIEAGDLFGDGVNVAARLEGLAEPGGICISGSTLEQVKNKLSIAFHDIGAQKVKNIPEAIPAFRVVPGEVSVKSARPTALGLLAARLPGRVFWVTAAVLGFLLIGAGAAVMVGLDSLPDHSFDGHWRVSVDSKSGCAINDPGSFPITVRQGMIDEPNQRFPKSGQIAPDGTFTITVHDEDGRPRAVQEGRVDSDRGEGTMKGRRPGCSGIVKLQRQE